MALIFIVFVAHRWLRGMTSMSSYQIVVIAPNSFKTSFLLDPILERVLDILFTQICFIHKELRFRS